MADSTEVAHLADIPLEVEALVAGPVLRVGELLALGVGSVLATSHPAGGNVEIFVGGAYVGAGELARATGRRVVRMVQFKSRS